MKKHGTPTFAATLLLLPVLYVGSYLAMVVPEGVPLILDGKNFGGHGGNYRYNPDLLSEKAFYPLEQIDRKVRPAAWEARLADPYDYSTRPTQ